MDLSFGKRSQRFFASVAALTVVSALGANTIVVAAPIVRPQTAIQHANSHVKRATFTTPIQHIVVIVQENRSIDNLFHGYPDGTSFPGLADTVNVDPVSLLPLQPCSLDQVDSTGCPTGSGHNKHCDLSHSHSTGFVGEYTNGSMSGFNDPGILSSDCVQVMVGSNLESPTFSYVPMSEASQYWDFAKNYSLYDHALQTNSGPSFPSHQYLIAGQAGGLDASGNIVTAAPWSISENHTVYMGAKGGNSCLSKSGTTATTLDLTTAYPGTEYTNKIPPCNSYKTIFDEMDAAGLSWQYYTNREDGLWGGPSAVSQDCGGKNPTTKLCNNNKIVNCSPQALANFLNNSFTLPNLTYVIPEGAWSDHPISVQPDPYAGPNWVSNLINAIGLSKWWKNTAIVVVWDDWGGWYDHFQPPAGGLPNQSIIHCAINGTVNTPGSCGFRTPLMVISPYIKTAGIVDSSTTNAAGSILLYIEHSFGLPQLSGPRSTGELGTADTWTTDDLTSTMKFIGISSHPYVPEPVSTPASYYTNQIPDCDSTGPSFHRDAPDQYE